MAKKRTTGKRPAKQTAAPQQPPKLSLRDTGLGTDIVLESQNISLSREFLLIYGDPRNINQILADVDKQTNRATDFQRTTIAELAAWLKRLLIKGDAESAAVVAFKLGRATERHTLEPYGKLVLREKAFRGGTKKKLTKDQQGQCFEAYVKWSSELRHRPACETVAMWAKDRFRMKSLSWMTIHRLVKERKKTQ